ncbi:MAG: DUF4131 domain-containing protein, partial [Proteobacteria bacterium]|nr:DUF4131 domain-containing protein [Pseudomonadota bacterium]
MSFITHFFFDDIYKEQTRIILWMPVFFMIGIFFYFSLQDEPSLTSVLLPLFLFICLSVIFFKHPILKMCFICTFFICFGFSNAYFKTHYLNTKMLKIKKDDQIIKGIITEQEYTPDKDAYKITIDLACKIDDIKRIRLTLKDTSKGIPEVGDYIEATATLLPFSDPVSLFSYDFRRAAYFNGISASGRISSLHSLKKSENSTIKKTRNNLTDFIRKHINGQAGEIAIAVTTGFR